MKKLSQINEGVMTNTLRRFHTGDTRKQDYTGTNLHLLKPVEFANFNFYVANDILRKKDGTKYFSADEVDELSSKINDWRIMSVSESMEWVEYWGIIEHRHKIINENGDMFVCIKDENEHVIKLPLCGFIRNENKMLPDSLCFWVSPAEYSFFDVNLAAYRWNDDEYQDVYATTKPDKYCILLVKDK